MSTTQYKQLLDEFKEEVEKYVNGETSYSSVKYQAIDINKKKDVGSFQVRCDIAEVFFSFKELRTRKGVAEFQNFFIYDKTISDSFFVITSLLEYGNVDHVIYDGEQSPEFLVSMLGNSTVKYLDTVEDYADFIFSFYPEKIDAIRKIISHPSMDGEITEALYQMTNDISLYPKEALDIFEF